MNKKEHPRFAVPNLGAKHRKGVKDRWRKQRGIDNKKRIMRKGYGALPGIGYKNSDEMRHRRQDGRYNVLVHNEKELRESLEMSNVSIVLAHQLSRRKRLELQRIAEKSNARIVNKVNR